MDEFRNQATSLPAHAEALARYLHAGQVDKAGRPYVEHLEAVVGILLRRWPDAPEEAVAAAWLHDALEDTDVSVRDLLGEHEISIHTIDLMLELTRHRWFDFYNDWIEYLSLCGSPHAIRIKLADLEHNSDPARAIPGSDLVERRYAPARGVLERALAEREFVG